MAQRWSATKSECALSAHLYLARPKWDRYGHQAGDTCLKRIAAALQSSSRRPADLVARYGGEEFAPILPETGLADAVAIAEAVRKAVAHLDIDHAAAQGEPFVRLSTGVAVVTRKPGSTPEALIAAADQALYQAKWSGRNRVVAMETGASA